MTTLELVVSTTTVGSIKVVDHHAPGFREDVHDVGGSALADGGVRPVPRELRREQALHRHGVVVPREARGELLRELVGEGIAGGGGDRHVGLRRCPLPGEGREARAKGSLHGHMV